MHTEQANLAEEQSSQDEVLNTENSMLSSGEMVLMQTARADINNPDNGFQQKYTYASRLRQSTNVHNRITGQEDESRNWKKRGNHAGNICSEITQKIQIPTTKLDIVLKDGSTLNLSANVAPHIAGSVQKRPVNLKSLKNWK